MFGIALLVVLTAAPAPKPKKAKGAAPATVVKPPTDLPAPTPVTPSVDLSKGSPQNAVAQLSSLFEALEYDQVAVLAGQVLAREDLTIDQRLEAYRLQGSAKAIVEDPLDAEKPFRLLLRARTDYELPANTPPKILAVFRKVQSEEKALSSQLKEVERTRTIANLKLIGDAPATAQGGLPLKFNFRLRDPTGAVESIRVPFRRAGEKVFSSLALQRSEDGDWRGAIPGDLTADEHGFQLEYYVETVDAAGPLLSLGSLQEPKSIPVLAGLVPVARFKPVPRGVFWASFVLTALAGGAAGGFGVAYNNSQYSYRQLTVPGAEVEAATVNARITQGTFFATGTNVSLISAGALAVITAVLIPFTNFTPE